MHFDSMGQFIGETSLESSAPRMASSDIAPLLLGAAGGVNSDHHPEEFTAEQIINAQTRLTELGFDPGPIDGIMGPITVVALRQYQQINGLPATGMLDWRTMRALGM
jgi:hypothetical protein